MHYITWSIFLYIFTGKKTVFMIHASYSAINMYKLNTPLPHLRIKSETGYERNLRTLMKNTKCSAGNMYKLTKMLFKIDG